MNERIKQLWEEAAKTTQGDSWEEQTKFMEKFAELIVRECAFIAQNKDDTEIDLRFGRGVAAFKILEHFGVEE